MNAIPEHSQRDARPAFVKAWEDGTPEGVDRHPYLQRKRISAPQVLQALRIIPWQGSRYLAVPYRSIATGDVCAVQRISDRPNAKKILLPGSKWADGVFNIGGEPPSDEGTILIAEGMASAYACWRADPHGIAFAGGPITNMRSVAKAVGAAYPRARIVIVSDAGVEARAREAAAACGGYLALMPDGSSRGFDAWDYLAQHGDEPDELKRAVLDRAVRVEKEEHDEHDERRNNGSHHGADRLHVRGKLKCLADVAPEPVRWLFEGWIPLGKLMLFAGMGGTGKTTLALKLAGITTRGGTWPDGTTFKGGRDVVIWTSEDNLADTLVPRLMAAGADLSRVHAVIGQTDDGKEVPFDPSSDMPTLLAAFEGHDVALLIIDPLMSAIAGDAYRPNEVRRALQPVIDLASTTGCAVMGITHFSKSSKTGSVRAIERVIGSQAFVAVSRMTWLAAHNERTGRRVFARAKSNLAPEYGGFEFSTCMVPVTDSINAQCVEWGVHLDASADEIIDSVDDSLSAQRASRQDAERFLRDLLADGPRTHKDVMAEASGAGIPRNAIEEAAARLGVERRKSTAFHGPWLWALGA